MPSPRSTGTSETSLKCFQLSSQRFEFGDSPLRVGEFVGDDMSKARLIGGGIGRLDDELTNLTDREPGRLSTLNESDTSNS